MSKKYKIVVAILVAVIIMCIGIYTISKYLEPNPLTEMLNSLDFNYNDKLDNNILMIAAIYPPNIEIESHLFVVKKDGEMYITKGKREASEEFLYGVSPEALWGNNFITDVEETGSVMVSQEELTKLIDLVDKLDSTGKQATRGLQYGGYVTAVYYNGRLHESCYETPEFDVFYSDPIENQLTNQTIIFLLEQSHIPLNNEAWWF